MTKLRSITDIASLYDTVRLNESNIIEEKANKTPKNTFPDSNKKVKTSKAFNEAGPEKVKGYTKLKKNKKKRGKISERNINSFMKSKFDKLFENVMDDEMDVKMDLGPGVGPEGESEDIDLDIDSETGGDEVTFTLDRETAQKLHDVLMSVLGGEEEGESEEESDLEDLGIEDEGESSDMGEEETEDEDEEEETEDEDEENYFEEVEAEKLPETHGKKLTQDDNKVPGALRSPSKGKASGEVTKASDLTALGDKGHQLTKPGNNVVGNYKKGGSFIS